jgi:hypothetical protein
LTSPLAWPDKNCAMPVVPPGIPRRAVTSSPVFDLADREASVDDHRTAWRASSSSFRSFLLFRSVSTMANRDRLVRSCAAAFLLTIGLGLSARSAESKGTVKAVDVEG